MKSSYTIIQLPFLFSIVISRMLNHNILEDKDDHRNLINEVRVSYTVWAGTNVMDSYTRYVTARSGANLYRVMKIAEEHDYVDYGLVSFCTAETGHIPYSIGQHFSDYDNKTFWLIYKVPDLPDVNNPPTQEFMTETGIDTTFVQDGENYLLWLRDTDFLGGLFVLNQVSCPEWNLNGIPTVLPDYKKTK